MPSFIIAGYVQQILGRGHFFAAHPPPPPPPYTSLANLKSYVDKLDTEKLKHLLNNLSSLKSKIDKLDFHKLVPVPVDLSKLSDLGKKMMVLKKMYITLG